MQRLEPDARGGADMELTSERGDEKRTRWQRVKAWLVSALEARANRYFLPPSSRAQSDKTP
ncbi:hypothetical protein Pcaca04_16340 [Pectobacterium carotovorum subsp. carotovorum]|nr:hypothetical protein Pcaca04_16340 [Pectobacterium carotovorum subsp. carotovorum]